MKTRFNFSQIALVATLVFWTSWTYAVQDIPWKSEFSDLLAEQADAPGPEYKFSGDFTIEKGKQSGTLNVVLDIKESWHGYSQKKLQGQTSTEFRVAPNVALKAVGKFTADKNPKRKKNELGHEIEEFSGRVIWSAPIELAENVAPENLTIDVEVFGQVCKQSCIQFAGKESQVSAKFSEYTEKLTAYVSDHGSFSGTLDKQSLTPGDTATITFSAKMAPSWHVYQFETFKREGTTPQPTIIYFTKTSGLKVTTPIASEDPIKHETGLPDEPFSFYHENKVDWTTEIKAPKDLAQGQYVLEGKIIFQLCTNQNCDRPTTLNFQIPIEIAARSILGPVNLLLSENDLSRDEMMSSSKQFWNEENSSGISVALISTNKLTMMLWFAFLAGLILNAMPCVLPVIGLKVMSFVQQAGENRSRIFLLNLVFSLGLLVVFWILATLSAFFGVGWGDWLTKSMTGSIIITSVVFAFGLSMLGVWEIPIPGLSGASSISKKSTEEGLLGAFFLGILTTILATPCTGPMLIPAVTATIGQPPWVAYLIFTTIGLGMALPYLMVGLFPSLIGWLPRPGAWMTTFKNVTGFILLATVVFLMSSFSSEPRSDYLVAMMSTLLVIAFGCWWIGRTSIAAEASEQLKAWGSGLSIIAAGSFVAFMYLGPAKYELNWQQYSKTTLGELRDDNRLVFIDFTGPN